MKLFAALVFCLLLIAGCGGNDPSPTSASAPTTVATLPPTTTPAQPDTAPATITALSAQLATAQSTPEPSATSDPQVAGATRTAGHQLTLTRRAIKLTTNTVLVAGTQTAIEQLNPRTATPSRTPLPTGTPTWDASQPTNTPTRIPTKTPRNTPPPTVTATATSCVPGADRSFVLRVKTIRQNWLSGWSTLAKSSQDFNYEPEDGAWMKFKGLVDVTVRNFDLLKLPADYSTLQPQWDLMKGNIRAIFESQPSDYRTWPPLHDAAETAWTEIVDGTTAIDSHACP
jgi:hypothetical protein